MGIDWAMGERGKGKGVQTPCTRSQLPAATTETNKKNMNESLTTRESMKREKKTRKELEATIINKSTK